MSYSNFHTFLIGAWVERAYLFGAVLESSRYESSNNHLLQVILNVKFSYPYITLLYYITLEIFTDYWYFQGVLELNITKKLRQAVLIGNLNHKPQTRVSSWKKLHKEISIRKINSYLGLKYKTALSIKIAGAVTTRIIWKKLMMWSSWSNWSSLDRVTLKK